MNKVRVAVVGAGIYGANHIQAYAWNRDVELVAVCDFKPERLAAVAEKFGVNTYTDVNQMLAQENLDAVSIATPDAYHLEPALAAIMQGKHVLIEKPLATTIEDARKIIAAAEQHNVRVAVDYHKRWDPAAINLRNELRLSTTGRPIRGYMSMDDVIDVPTKWFDWAHHSSPVHFLGTHCYDQIRWYMGCEVEEVYAVGSKTVLKERGIDTYDTVQAFLKFENGCYWTVENSWIFPSGFPKANDGRTQILTEHALLKADSQNRGVEFYNAHKCRTPNSYFIIDNNGRPFGFGIEPINDFIDCLIHDKPFIATAQDGLEAEKIADAVHISLETHQAVKIAKG
ncbi:Gfo/Idh/MocA family oxidoreductase [Paramixta manurensis]|uniref:Gfo/Idh/MocA family oxidoreductase n=1 Tax=Paramixta manurensis TaxID=2740817 RepID=A0A6M8UDD2_9GAMM|nr:Gfo/Idh/MocA family oxidoreductase [Erwiniaceae bacterium PD-1]